MWQLKACAATRMLLGIRMRRISNLEGVVVDADGVLWQKNSIQVFGKMISIEKQFEALQLVLRKNPERNDEIFSTGMRLLKGLPYDVIQKSGKKAAQELGIDPNFCDFFMKLRDSEIKIGVLSGGLDIVLKEILPIKQIDFLVCNKLVFTRNKKATGVAKGMMLYGSKTESLRYHIASPRAKYNGLERVCNRINLDLSNTIAVGHDYVDSLFLKHVGLPITFRSAEREIRDIVVKEKGVILDRENLSDILKVVFQTRGAGK
jgi:phosphoserine phosphatase